jgi:hypothetical protein
MKITHQNVDPHIFVNRHNIENSIMRYLTTAVIFNQK